jgi:hypothetical protein
MRDARTFWIVLIILVPGLGLGLWRSWSSLHSGQPLAGSGTNVAQSPLSVRPESGSRWLPIRMPARLPPRPPRQRLRQTSFRASRSLTTVAA